MAIDNKNMQAAALANLPFDKHRSYLMVVATSEVTVTISGGEPFTIATGGIWNPKPAAMNDIVFTGTGTMVTG